MSGMLRHHFAVAAKPSIRVSVAAIQRAVAVEFELDVAELLGPCKKRRYSRPRQIAMFLAVKLTPCSQPTLARIFRRSDHKTIVHGANAVAIRLKDDPALAGQIERLARRLVHGD